MEDQAERVAFADLTVGKFVDRLASAAPVPGGGAASAVAAALGAALVAMVARLSLGKEKYASYEQTLRQAEATATELSGQFLGLADRDAEAYAAYGSALKMPRDTEEQQQSRRAAVRAAARVASEVPLDCVLACTRLATAAESIAGRSNLNASSDVLVAALLADAAARGAAENVRINLPATGDEAYADEVQRHLDARLHEVTDCAARTREAVLSGKLRDPEAT